MLKTIYVVTTDQKNILSAFTTRRAAEKEIKNTYSNVLENCVIEECALNFDFGLWEEIKNTEDIEMARLSEKF